MDLKFFREYFSIHRDLKDSTRTELTEITGCRQPCFYRKFSKVGNSDDIKSFDNHGNNFRDNPTLSELPFLGYNLRLASSEVNVEEDYFLYDFVSLISELGGALGLFLGFSFFMITDYVAPMQNYMKKRFKHFFTSNTTEQ